MQKHRMWIRRVSSKENNTRSRFTKCVLNGKHEILNLSHEEGGGLSDGWGAWKGPGPGGGNLTCWLYAPWDSQVQWCRRQSDPKDQIQRVTIGNESWGVTYGEAVRGIMSKQHISKDKSEKHAWAAPSPVVFPRSAVFYWTHRVKSLVFINIRLH